MLSGLGEVDVAREGKIERSELVAVEFVLEGEVDEVADLGEVFVLLY